MSRKMIGWLGWVRWKVISGKYRSAMDGWGVRWNLTAGAYSMGVVIANVYYSKSNNVLSGISRTCTSPRNDSSFKYRWGM